MSTFLNSIAVGARGQQTLPAVAYISAELFAAEQRQVFGTRWLCVGRESDIAAPGAYMVREIGVESLIIVRDQGGSVRAHFNVCRHRGTRICEETHGTFSNSIQCPYHAWTYGLDGELIGVPDIKELDNFSKGDFPLHAADCGVWEGFIFVNIGEDAESFVSAFAPLIDKWSAWNLPSLQRLGRVVYDVKANWKLIVQNYSECYHCSPVHPALVKLSPPTSGGNDLIDGPFLGGFMDVPAPGGSMTLSGRACGAPVGDLTAADMQRVYYYSLFPNMLLSLHHDYVMVHTLWPKAPGHTTVECEWLFHPDTATTPAFDPQDGIAFWDQTNKEDWHVSELTQLGVASSRYAPGPYSAREAMSAAFDREYVQAMSGSGFDL